MIEIIECNQDDHAGFRGKRGNEAQHLDLDVEINSRRSGWRKPMINASSLTDCGGEAGKRETSQLSVSANAAPSLRYKMKSEVTSFVDA